MVNYSTSGLLISVLSSILLLSCNKEPLTDNEVQINETNVQSDDYRLEFIGNYTCIGRTHDWNEATGFNKYSSDTITLIVKIDSTSNNMIYANNDLIPIDTNGYLSQFYVPPGYRGYLIDFFSMDSVSYYVSTGGNGGGHWGNYLGSK